MSKAVVGAVAGELSQLFSSSCPTSMIDFEINRILIKYGIRTEETEGVWNGGRY